MKRKVISSKNLPTTIPISWTLVFAFALDKWNAPQWLWGAIGLLVLFAWIGTITTKIKEEEVDIFEEKKK